MTLRSDLEQSAILVGQLEVKAEEQAATIGQQAQMIADLDRRLKECLGTPDPDPVPVPIPLPNPGDWPVGGVRLAPGDNIAAAVNANPAGTRFRFAAGTHTFTAPLVLKGGNEYIADDPGNRPKLVGAAGFPFANATTGGVMLKGLDISNFGPANSDEGAGMVHYSSGNDWLIEDCNIGGTKNVVVRWGPGWVLRRTRLHDGGRFAMSGGTNTGVKKIFDCEWVHCGYVATDSDRGGCKFAVTTGVEIDGLHVHDIRGNGIWCDIKNMKVKLNNVTVEDCTRAGIFIEVSYGPVEILNPKIRRCGSEKKSGEAADWPVPAGIQLSMTPDVTITNPLVEDCRNGITVIQWNHPQILGVKDGKPFGTLDASKCGNENIIVTGGKVTRCTEHAAGLAGTKPARAGRPTRNVHWNNVAFDAGAKFRSSLHI